MSMSKNLEVVYRSFTFGPGIPKPVYRLSHSLLIVREKVQWAVVHLDDFALRLAEMVVHAEAAGMKLDRFCRFREMTRGG